MSRKAVEPAEYPFFDYRRFTFSLGIEAADRVFMSGSTAVIHDKASNAMVVTGDLAAQARLIFDKMRYVLEARSLGFKDITRLGLYLTPAAKPQMAQLEAVLAELVPQKPQINIIPVERLLRDAALIEIEGVANITATTAKLVSVFAEGDPAGHGIVEQCRLAYREIAEKLIAAGSSLDCVVKTTEFITPDALAAYRDTATVRRETFAAPYPAATGVIMSALPRPGCKIQIEAIATLGSMP